jgi:tRNA dimethylallyltransferase
MASSSRPAPAPSARVIAVFGPTASGKTAVGEALVDLVGGAVVSADSAAVYRELPILTAAPERPTRLVGIFSVSDDVSVGEFQRRAHQAIDEIVADDVPAVVVGGTGLYLRAALSSMPLPPPPTPETRRRWEEVYDRVGPVAAHELLAGRDPAAAARVHANDRRRVVRALELAEVGASLAPASDRLWSEDTRHPTLLAALELSASELERRIRMRARDMVQRGVVDEARRALATGPSEAARKVMGLEQFATLPVDDAVEEFVRANLRLARYQRKWLRRLPSVATLAAERDPEEIAADIAALAGAGKRLPRR